MQISTNYYRPAMIMSTDPAYLGNMEIVRWRSGNKLEHLWWNPNLADWIKSGDFGSNCRGDPALCSNLNDNLLQVVVREYGNLVHYWRTAGLQWVREGQINPYFSDLYYIYSPALLCNTVNHNLEAAATIGGNFVHYYVRNGYTWSYPQQLFLMSEFRNGTILNGPSMAQDDTPEKRMWVVAYFTDQFDVYLMVWTRAQGSSWEKWGGLFPPEGDVYDYNVKPHLITYHAGSTSYVSILVKIAGYDNRRLGEIELDYYNSSGLRMKIWDIGESTAHLISATTRHNDGNQDDIFVHTGHNPNYIRIGQGEMENVLGKSNQFISTVNVIR